MACLSAEYQASENKNRPTRRKGERASPPGAASFLVRPKATPTWNRRNQGHSSATTKASRVQSSRGAPQRTASSRKLLEGQRLEIARSRKRSGLAGLTKSPESKARPGRARSLPLNALGTGRRPRIVSSGRVGKKLQVFTAADWPCYPGLDRRCVRAGSFAGGSIFGRFRRHRVLAW